MPSVSLEAAARVRDVREILVVELLGGLGDVLISLGAIQALARSYPEARLTVLTFPPGGELLEEDPLIHEVVYAPTPGPARLHSTREAVEEMLARKDWDLVASDTSYDGIDGLIRNCGVPLTAANLWRAPPPRQRVGGGFFSQPFRGGHFQPRGILPP